MCSRRQNGKNLLLGGTLLSRIYDAQNTFSIVYVYKLFHDFGRLDKLDSSCKIEGDYTWMALYEALQAVSDAVWIDYVESWELQKFYFSDPVMVEYYRLCRTHCQCFGGRLSENPYMKQAAEYVDHLLNLPYGNYGYTLQTKINHDWASGIVFYFDDYFECHMELIEVLLYIFDFYRTELEKLKSELSLGGETAAAESCRKEAA